MDDELPTSSGSVRWEGRSRFMYNHVLAGHLKVENVTRFSPCFEDRELLAHDGAYLVHSLVRMLSRSRVGMDREGSNLL